MEAASCQYCHTRQDCADRNPVNPVQPRELRVDGGEAAEQAVAAAKSQGSDAGISALRGCASSDSATFRAAYLRGMIDMDPARSGNPAPLDALMLLPTPQSQCPAVLEVVADLVSSKETGRSAPDSRYFEPRLPQLATLWALMGAESWLRHTSTPYLIGTALRLADACDVIDAVVGSAALQVGRPPALSTSASDSRSQAARAHLEALLPAMAAEESGAEAPRRLELLSGIEDEGLSLVQAPPLAFVRSVYGLLARALIRPLSRESRKNLEEAPEKIPRMAMSQDLRELGELLTSLMAAAVAEVEMFEERQGVALPLMCALLTRVPAKQRFQVFKGRLWQQLTELIDRDRQNRDRFGDRERDRVTFQSAALAAILCQAPESASAFFEAAGFSAILRPEMLSCRMRLAPSGLHALDTTHPASLVAVLQVLVSMVGVLPTHSLVLHSTLQWLEKHLQPLLDVLQWVTRLPMTLSAEPRRAGHLSTLSSMVSSLAARSGGTAGRCGPDAMLVHCQSQSMPCDASVDGLAVYLSRQSLSGVSEEGGVALCYRCVSLFIELWALLTSAVGRRTSGGSVGSGSGSSTMAPDICKFQQLEAVIHPALPGLAVQVVSAGPDQNEMSDTGTTLLESMLPSESTKLKICSNVLHEGVSIDGRGSHQCIHFVGAAMTFRHLLYIVETSLHLLCLHLTLLTAAADLEGSGTGRHAPSLSAGIPRLAVVGQYLRLLIEFAAASGGSVALADDRCRAGSISNLLPLSFAANVALTVTASILAVVI
eukprot:Skav219588  [mRNA]  locus=scaffold2589:60128:69957:- [translate_table: standard]